ncbi:MAG TPA: C4-dicarboxylate ABC transporter, partial [Conexibacter sp.]|nr:C4-dicarboxylate ABC transporter [Conexibacter sp.]
MRIAPNWFTAAMGTGIVANAAMLLPLDLPGLHALALAAWVAAVLLLARLAALAVEQRRRDRRDRCDAASGLDAVAVARVAALPRRSLATMPFWGAPPMALTTVAAGTLLVGRDLVGERAALLAAVVLWSVGTLGGLVAALAVPRWLLTHPDRRLDHVFAT